MDEKDFEQQITAILRQEQSVEFPPARLLPRVMLEIQQQQQVFAKKKLVMIIASFVSLAFLTIITWSSARLQLSQSGMGQMISLVFTDFRSVLANWQSYILLLLESLPVASLVLALASATGLLVLFKFFVQTARQTAILTHK